ncbi:MAG: thioredoxin family protein [Candidatus Bathyarchaeota archaeon]
MIQDIQHTDLEPMVSSSKEPVVVEYWHHKCPACLEMKPVYEKLEARLRGRARLVRMNLLESRENRVLAIKQGVRSTPTFMIYCGGAPIGIILGVRTLDEIEAEVNALLEVRDSCLKGTPLEIG